MSSSNQETPSLSPLQDIRSRFTDLFGWEGDDLLPIDFVIASYLAPFLCGDVQKPWGCLVGPASAGKTEIIEKFDDSPFEEFPRTIVRDTITENAFSSSYRDENDPRDISLAKMLSNEVKPVGPKCLMVKDLTTILSKRSEVVSTFFGEMRSAYDGRLIKHAGNVGTDDKGTLGFGFVAACTEHLDDIRKKGQALGERILLCRMGKDYNKYENRWKALSRIVPYNRIEKAKMRADLNKMVVDYIQAGMKIATDPEKSVSVVRSHEMVMNVKKLVAIATSLRSSPISKKTLASTGEVGHRVEGQVHSWGDALCLFDGRTEWSQQDYNLVRRILQDTIPPDYLRAINSMWKGTARESLVPMSADEIREKGKCDDDIYRQLKQWVLIGNLVEHSSGEYGLNAEMAQHIEDCGYLEGVSEDHGIRS